jgi:1,3-beta-galactosyl-N-acetylhexosamine phosphorylase
MEDKCKTGRVTIPTDLDVVPETLEILKKWGADAIRDCDGTDFPQQLKDADAKIYSTYYTTRKDNAWAKANPDEVQQCYIMTGFYTAPGDTVTIPLMKGISPELMQVNTNDDITRWWEVMDRSTGQPVPPEQWSYADGSVTVQAVPFHEYTVSFLAYLIWDPVHMYNATTNGWTNFEHQITFDVRQPKTHKYSMERLRKFIAEHPYVNVIRYTTFFHQFTLIFDELKREKFVDWYGYSASVSPYILNQFEQEVGYKFRPEYIIDQGYYNNQYRVPSREYRDFQAFQRREVAKLAKEMVDITHACGCEAMMFLGDHWIGTEPFMPEFKTIGLDAVVGSVGNGSTLRLISDIEGVKYTEGRFLLPAIRARYLRYPAFVEAVADRHERYNETLSYISMLEQAGADYVIRPPIPLEIGAMERDPDQLRRVYETGRAVAQIQIDKIKAFLDAAKAEPEA